MFCLSFFFPLFVFLLLEYILILLTCSLGGFHDIRWHEHFSFSLFRKKLEYLKCQEHDLCLRCLKIWVDSSTTLICNGL